MKTRHKPHGLDMTSIHIMMMWIFLLGFLLQVHETTVGFLVYVGALTIMSMLGWKIGGG